MKSLFHLIVLFVLVVPMYGLRARDLAVSAEQVFPAQDNGWQLIRISMNAPGEQRGLFYAQDARGGPRLARQIDFADQAQLTFYLSLPLVAADELREFWPLQMGFIGAKEMKTQVLNLPLKRESEPVYRLLVMQNAVPGGLEALRAALKVPIYEAQLSASDVPVIAGADGAFMPRGLLYRDENLSRRLLAGGIDLWAQGTTAPEVGRSSLQWQPVIRHPSDSELSVWKLSAPASAMKIVDPNVLKLPRVSAQPPVAARIYAIGLPLAGTVLIVALWLMSRRAWMVLMLSAIVLPGGAMAGLMLAEKTSRPLSQEFSFDEGDGTTKILCEHRYRTMAELISMKTHLSQRGDLPSVPLAGSRQQWFGMNDVMIVMDSDDLNETKIQLPARRQLMLYTREIRLPEPAGAPTGERFVAGRFEPSGQTWESWLTGRPTSERAAWKTWWTLHYQPEKQYFLSGSGRPLIWRIGPHEN